MYPNAFPLLTNSYIKAFNNTELGQQPSIWCVPNTNFNMDFIKSIWTFNLRIVQISMLKSHKKKLQSLSLGGIQLATAPASPPSPYPQCTVSNKMHTMSRLNDWQLARHNITHLCRFLIHAVIFLGVFFVCFFISFLFLFTSFFIQQFFDFLKTLLCKFCLLPLTGLLSSVSIAAARSSSCTNKWLVTCLRCFFLLVLLLLTHTYSHCFPTHTRTYLNARSQSICVSERASCMH